MFTFFLSISSLPDLLKQKVFLLWIARMILQTSVVLLSTIILSLFIAYNSETLLPILLLFQAIFLFLGNLLVMPLLRKYPVKKILIAWLIIGGIFLFTSLLIPVFFMEWAVMLITLCFFLWHALVFFALYIEQIFSPEEAEHAIPLIESGEPIGGIIAGIIAASGAYFISTESLQAICGMLILVSASIVAFSSFFLEDVHLQHKEEEHLEKKPFWDEIFDFCILAFKTPLLKKFFWAGILQAIIFVIVEYQYLLAAAELLPHASEASVQSEIATQLTHGLGLFHVAVFSALFLIQIFAATWIQKKLGVIRSLWLQPFALLANTFLMIAFALVPLGMLGKGIYEVFGGIQKNAIASSFYVFKTEIREQAREFLEGIARPVGMLLGALLIIFFTTVIPFFNTTKTMLLYSLGGIVIIATIGYWLVTKSAPTDYTRMAERNIRRPHLPEEKFDALEIFSQNGHENASWILSDVLKNTMEPTIIKILALKGIAIHNDMELFADVLACIENSEEEIQMAALETMLAFAKAQMNFSKHPFSKERMVQVLQESFEKNDSKRIRMKILQILSYIHASEMVPFLIQKTHHKNTDIAFCSILGCGSFRDISIAPFILPFLENKNAYIKSASIIALWPFHRYREILLSQIIQMIQSLDENMRMSGIYTVGELNISSEYARLKSILLEETHPHIRKHIVIALAKMGDHSQIPNLATLLFHKDEKISGSTKKLINSPGIRLAFETQLNAFLRQKVLQEIRNIAKEHRHQHFSAIDKPIRERIIWLYKSIGSEKMVARLQHFHEAA